MKKTKNMRTFKLKEADIEKIDRLIKNAGTDIQEAVYEMIHGDEFDAIKSIMRAYDEISSMEYEVATWQE